MEDKNFEKLVKAQHRVTQIKRFYNHIAIFVIINTALLLSKERIISALFGKEALNNSATTDWVYVNIYVWLGILAIHAVVVFAKIPDFVKKWEQRQIEKIMKEEDTK